MLLCQKSFILNFICCSLCFCSYFWCLRMNSHKPLLIQWLKKLCWLVIKNISIRHTAQKMFFLCYTVLLSGKVERNYAKNVGVAQFALLSRRPFRKLRAASYSGARTATTHIKRQLISGDNSYQPKLISENQNLHRKI